MTTVLTKDEKIDMSDYKRKEFEKKGIELGFSGKQLETHIKTHMGIWEREQREKEKKEAKLLGTAMQQLLPEIFEDKRAIPNCFLRGALFGMVGKGKRKLVGDMPIFTMSQYDLIFTGYELDQNDLEVWDTLMYLAKERNVDNEIRITLYDLCQQMRISYSSTNRKALVKRIKRLASGLVSIKTEGKEYFGSLINDGYIDTAEDGKLVVSYNKKLTPLFADKDYTFISSDIRQLLGDNQLARWLYNFYESHNQPMAFSIYFIKKLCRSSSEPKEFKRLLKHSLELVKKAHLAVDIKSKWDYEISKNDYIHVYPKGKTKKQLELFSKF